MVNVQFPVSSNFGDNLIGAGNTAYVAIDGRWEYFKIGRCRHHRSVAIYPRTMSLLMCEFRVIDFMLRRCHSFYEVLDHDGVSRKILCFFVEPTQLRTDC